MDYAKAIRIVRSARNLSKKQLADRLHVNPSYVSMLETGARQPGREVLEALSKALSVPLYLLMLLASEQHDHHGLPQQETEEFGTRLLQALIYAQETIG